MPSLDLIPVGPVEGSVLDGLRLRLGRHGFTPRVSQPNAALSGAFDARLPRLQAVPIIAQLRKGGGDHVLGITDKALTDGVREWVYGLGEVNGRAAVFSTEPFRRGGLSQESFLDRMSAAVLHELAHNVGMVHCRNRGCLLNATHEPAAMRQLELAFCGDCERSFRRRIRVRRT